MVFDVAKLAKTEEAPIITGNLRRSITAPEFKSGYPLTAVQPIQATYARKVHERNPYMERSVARSHAENFDTIMEEAFRSVFK